MKDISFQLYIYKWHSGYFTVNFPLKLYMRKLHRVLWKIETRSHMHLVTFDPNNMYISNESISL